MVESTKKSSQLTKSHNRIEQQFASNAKLEATELDLQDLSRTLVKMAPSDRTDRESISQTIDVLFKLADEKLKDGDDKEVVANLRKLVGQVEQDLYKPKPRYLDAFFFPNKSNVYKLEKYIKMARKELLVCVFNLTNDVLAAAIKDRHDAGVKVRIITDDECMTNKGNDCKDLADYGIPVRTDSEPSYHMHNKFMLVDGVFLLTGSFNWTFQAGSHNQENLLVVDHPFYLEKYAAEFNNLWSQFEAGTVEADKEKAAKKIQSSYRAKKAKQTPSNYKAAAGY
jgi:phosphatidylserine/phosphatidylglycerophosphate/cardiolipin synthase-like enzyme